MDEAQSMAGFVAVSSWDQWRVRAHPVATLSFPLARDTSNADSAIRQIINSTPFAPETDIPALTSFHPLTSSTLLTDLFSCVEPQPKDAPRCREGRSNRGPFLRHDQPCPQFATATTLKSIRVFQFDGFMFQAFNQIHPKGLLKKLWEGRISGDPSPGPMVRALNGRVVCRCTNSSPIERQLPSHLPSFPPSSLTVTVVCCNTSPRRIGTVAVWPALLRSSDAHWIATDSAGYFAVCIHW